MWKCKTKSKDIWSHRVPLPIQATSTLYLQDTNFVVVFQLVCKSWRKWCRDIEKNYTNRIDTTPLITNKQYIRALKIRYLFPCTTYTTVELLSPFDTPFDTMFDYLRPNWFLCSLCKEWKFIDQKYFRVEDACMDCAVHRLCVACMQHERHAKGKKCMSCSLQGLAFAGPFLRI